MYITGIDQRILRCVQTPFSQLVWLWCRGTGPIWNFSWAVIMCSAQIHFWSVGVKKKWELHYNSAKSCKWLSGCQHFTFSFSRPQNLALNKSCCDKISFQRNPVSWNLVLTQSRFGEILFGQNLISAKSCFCKIFYFEGTLHSCSVKKVGPAMRVEQESETLRICNAILKKTSDLFVFLADFSHLHPKEHCKHYRPYLHCTPHFFRYNWPEIYILGNYTTTQ